MAGRAGVRLDPPSALRRLVVPQGQGRPGRARLRAAVREIEEETGIVARLGRRLPTSTYPIGERTKQVDYWTARPVASSAFTPNSEVDELVWLPTAEAEARLSYRHDVDLLHEFLRGPSRTSPLVILRHASAGEKHEWREADALRPLDAPGKREAAALAGLLHAYGPLRVISSATARCLETVLPYARLARTSIVTDAAFTVGDTGPEQAVERLLSLTGAPRSCAPTARSSPNSSRACARNSARKLRTTRASTKRNSGPPTLPTTQWQPWNATAPRTMGRGCVTRSSPAGRARLSPRIVPCRKAHRA